MSFFVYILRCADGSYYTGMTSRLAKRLAEHQAGAIPGYTQARRPVELLWSAQFATHDEAFRRERQLKGWTRAKKEALIRGGGEAVHQLVAKGYRARVARQKG